MHLAASPPRSAAFDLILLIHVAAAIVSLVVVIASWAAARALLSATPGSSWPESGARYFREGPEVAGRALYLVPLSGFVLLAMSQGSFEVTDLFVLLGLGAWVIAIGAAEHLIFSSSKQLATTIAAGPVPSEDSWRALIKRVRLGSDVVAAMLLLATVLMVVQP